MKKNTTSGTCGKNLKWTLDDVGTLTISGTGEMDNWECYIDIPWYDNREDIKTAVIENGVTSIGERAFAHCTNLTSISIPDSVEGIGFGAFFNCTSLIKGGE